MLSYPLQHDDGIEWTGFLADAASFAMVKIKIGPLAVHDRDSAVRTGRLRTAGIVYIFLR